MRKGIVINERMCKYCRHYIQYYIKVKRGYAWANCGKCEKQNAKKTVIELCDEWECIKISPPQ